MKRLFAGSALLLLLVAGTANAQSFALRGGLSVDPDQVVLGAGGSFPAFAPSWRFTPNVEAGFGDGMFLLAMNAEMHYLFENVSFSWIPYLGGGLGLNYYDLNLDIPGVDDTDLVLGLNILGGMETTLARGNTVFLEMKIGIDDSPDFKFLVGISL